MEDERENIHQLSATLNICSKSFHSLALPSFLIQRYQMGLSGNRDVLGQDARKIQYERKIRHL